jgi:cholesterol transport system auxiliary component
MKLPTTRLWIAAVAVSSIIAGCVGVEKSYPDKHYFVLESRRAGALSNSKGSGVLQVASIRVSPRYEGRSFVYRRSDANFEADFYNQFLVAPGSLLSEEVRQAIAVSQLFQYVIGSTSSLEPTHVLEGTVNTLYGDFRDPSSPKAVLEMDFFLTKESPAKSEIVAQRRYAQAVAITGRTPEALIKGWNEALDAIMAALVADLKAANL